MREIKFRCWHKNGKHLHGMTFAPAMMYDETPGDCLKWKADRQEIVDIMQFTGLCDKNGKEIYEGDIVKRCAGYEGDTFENATEGEVRWDDGGFALVKPDYNSNTFEAYIASLDSCEVANWYIEVIGNIWEKEG